MAKTLTGTVTSDVADKTITVTVTSRETHPIYGKQYTVSRKYAAHDEKNEAKKGDLANRRRVIAGLNTQAAAFKLVDEIAPQLTARTSGHVRVERTRLRVGDGAQMAIIEFVDELKSAPVQEEVKA